jgi:RHH-type proline utilization regulon transcriptional repressor/proline dehydrogenase/delta 1-pyrroline-5-carboxylate dehydrogenase
VFVRGDAQDVDLVTPAARLTGTPYEVVGDDGLAARIQSGGATRLRTFTPVDDSLARACHAANVVIDDTPATGHGLIELARWTREQAISTTRHRHGRVPDER